MNLVQSVYKIFLREDYGEMMVTESVLKKPEEDRRKKFNEWLNGIMALVQKGKKFDTKYIAELEKLAKEKTKGKGTVPTKTIEEKITKTTPSEKAITLAMELAYMLDTNDTKKLDFKKWVKR